MFPASRLLISTVTQELNDLTKEYKAFQRLVEDDPNLRPNPPSPPKGDKLSPPSPVDATLKMTSSSSSGCGGADSDNLNPSGSSPGTRSEKLMTLSRQRTENRKSFATTGKVRKSRV